MHANDSFLQTLLGFEASAEEREQVCRIKIAFIGDPSTGKTCLLGAMKETIPFEKTRQTVGINQVEVDFPDCQIQDSQVRLVSLFMI